MNRVGRDEGILVLEVDIDNNQIVNMVQVISYLIGSNLSSDTSDDKISRCSIGDFVGDMWGYMKLSVAPANVELGSVSTVSNLSRISISPSSCVGRCRSAWRRPEIPPLLRRTRL